jgi:type I restriction enzyme, S subunit
MKAKGYPKYKNSGVEWLGAVPEHWEVKRVKYKATINDEALPETTAPDYEMLYVDISSVDPVIGIVQKDPMVFEEAPSRARRIVRDGDTIVSTVRTYLRAIASIKNPEKNLTVSTGFAVIRPRKISSDYLANALHSPSFIEEVVSRSVGVSYPAINASEIGFIKIPNPPPPEQKSIASFLDRETGQIDTLIAKKQRIVELLNEKRTALISRAVTKGLNPKAKMKPSGVEWLGEVPDHWIVKKLKWVYQNIGSGDGISPEDIEQSGKYPVYGGNGIMGYAEQFNSSGEDIIIGRVGAKCGNIYVVLGEKWISDNALRLEITHCCKNYIRLVLEIRDLNQLANKNAQPLITGGMVGNQFIPFPPLSEQQSISSFLDRETAKIDKLISKVEEAILKLKEYRTAIISAAVTGKIDVSTALNTGVREAA